MTRYSRRKALGLAAAATLVATAAPAAAPVAVAAPRQPTDQQIRDLFTLWNRALLTLDPEQVADRYSPDAILVPTLSNRVRADRAGIVEYFEHFLENRPQAMITESHVRVLDATSALDTGTYRFRLIGPDGSQRYVDARYTFVYERRHGTWLIVNHHSSAMPE
ncbi:SgcJ/EcaC family oxidoreductase [Paractinoplanes rishiriensis]|uniref:Calcium/calmodulin-dependent protein kinase II association-domain domain-containing protein n=1 Tax=Paractinoplanes rishiriensis TaxID=1050105 RepID=A0A919K1K2_9ACTN|nr:SgcJ/EcaC family oxidoreductase [Actinoplanes rishiriensis]GIE97532.1 hypothetical protein Ari01nite_49970 [Actinoplanes rishiriensis]